VDGSVYSRHDTTFSPFGLLSLRKLQTRTVQIYRHAPALPLMPRTHCSSKVVPVLTDPDPTTTSVIRIHSPVFALFYLCSLTFVEH
jgi:hypothetical protein